jgi:hypothetical protein
MTKISINEEQLSELSAEINWENWQGEDGEYFPITGVLYSRVEWLRDHLNSQPDSEEKEEHIETLDMLAKFLDAITIIE